MKESKMILPLLVGLFIQESFAQLPLNCGVKSTNNWYLPWRDDGGRDAEPLSYPWQVKEKLIYIYLIFGIIEVIFTLPLKVSLIFNNYLQARFRYKEFQDRDFVTWQVCSGALIKYENFCNFVKG